MICADTNPFVLAIVCLINILISIFYFIPFPCKICHAFHDFLGSKLFALIALDLSLFLAAVLYTVAPDSWPTNFFSQAWIVISFWLFFFFIFDVIWILIFPLSAISLIDPVWLIIKDIIKTKWKYAFGVDASDDLIMYTFIFIIVVTSLLTGLLLYYKFLHRIYYSIILSVLFVIAIKVMINNISTGKICCDFSNGEDMDQCPILFNLQYLIVVIIISFFGVWITMYKYEMLCFGRELESKTNQDKDIKIQSLPTSNQIYTRIDTDESTETVSLLQ